MLNYKQRAKFYFETNTMDLIEKIQRITTIIKNYDGYDDLQDEYKYLEKLWKLIEIRARKELYGS